LRLIPADKLDEIPPTQRLGTTRLVAHGLNVVFGPSGAYKSFYMLDASLRLAQSQPVVYVAGEGVGGLNKRVLAWCEHNQCSAGQSYFIGRAVNLLDSGEAASLVKLLNDLQPTVVIFDTLARCIVGADENSAKDIGRAVANSNYIQQSLKCAVVWVHHTNRAERGERGSGAIRGAADNMIEIFPNGDGSIQLSCSKDKDGEPWISEQLSFLPVGESGVLISTRGYAAMQYSEMEIRILEFLSLDTFEDGARVMQMVNSLNIPERTIYRLLSHLKRDCQITQGKRGDPFFLTEHGRSTLGVVSATDHDVTEIHVE
jgi:hypothetical protein